MKILHLQIISELTGILLIERGIQEPGNLGDYIHLMGEHCKIPPWGGIITKIWYRNVYALCRWLNHHVLGVSHVSFFYNQVLLYILMTKEKDFCICYIY